SDITGTASGYRELDRLTAGFQPGNLVIVAARPSMGKSALALGMAANVAVRHERPVALFTLEMSKSEVTQRLMCSEGKGESQRLPAVEHRHEKAPILSDLRESGSIEQDADLVMFVYRDEYYNPEETDSAGIAELILAKHRNGATDAIKLAFQKRYAKFSDLAAGAA